jgi:hypothetical protein
MIRQTRPVALVVIWSLIVTNLFPVAAPAIAAEESLAVEQEEVATTEKGLQFRLSESPDQPENKRTPALAPMTVMSDAETVMLLKRLPALESDNADASQFALRESSLPPPRTGATVVQTFPAVVNLIPAKDTETTLEVVRFSPEGEVPLAPNVSITFSQPMVAVTSQTEAAQNLPVKLSPQPAGRWRWVGTKTLVFDRESFADGHELHSYRAVRYDIS